MARSDQQTLRPSKETQSTVIAEWKNHIFKRIEVLSAKRRESGITSWALLTGAFAILIRLSIIINAKHTEDYISMFGLSFSSISLVSVAWWVASLFGQTDTSIAGMHIIKNTNMKGLYWILLLGQSD